MTVPVQITYNAYVANGATTVFPYGFKITDAADLEVTVDGVVTTTGFTVSGVGAELGGNVTFSVAPLNLQAIVLALRPILQRTTDYQQFGDLPANTIDADFDRLWLAMQAKDHDTDRAIKLPVDTADDQVLGDATARAGKLIGFDALGKLAMFVVSVGTSLVDLASSLGSSLIGHLPSGTGAVATTVATKLNEVKSTLDKGADSTGVANASASFTNLASTGGHVTAGTYLISDVQLRSTNLSGDGDLSILKAASNTTVLNLGYIGAISGWTKKVIEKLAIDGNVRVSDGITFADTASSEGSGRWSLNNLTIQNCKKGINKPLGNIGNVISDCVILLCDYGYYGVGTTLPLMHAGADTIKNSELHSNNLACIYIDSPQSGTGGTKILDSVIENNPGFGIFVKNYANAFTPLVMDNVWFEDNATALTVTINTVVYTPQDLYLENCNQAILRNSGTKKIQLVSSKLHIDGCLLDSTTIITKDSSSNVTIENAILDDCLLAEEIRSIASMIRAVGGTAPVFYSPARKVSTGVNSHNLYSETFAKKLAYAFTGTGTVNTTPVADGRIYPVCAELAIPINYTLLYGSFSHTINKWYVLTVDVKYISGTPSNLNFSITNSGAFTRNFTSILVTGEWRTIATIGYSSASATSALWLINGATSITTLRFSAYQVMEFDNKQDAINFYNSGLFNEGNTSAAITVAQLPTASVANGAKRIVSNATVTTFNSIVAGGGANTVPVFSDGTNWRIG